MTAGKPQASPTIGMNSIVVKESLPTTFEKTYDAILNYNDLLEPFLMKLEAISTKETIMVVEEHENDNEKEVEEIKMLSEVNTEPLLDLDKCSLHELLSLLQNYAKDPSINIHQAGFGSYIANHVLKEKIERYNREAMIPPKLGDVWVSKIQITIGKVTLHAILDLGSSVCVLSKSLYESLEIGPMEKCNIDLLLSMILPSML